MCSWFISGKRLKRKSRRSYHQFLNKEKSHHNKASNSVLKRHQYAASIIVQRVFRGNKDLEGKNVIVEGLGNPNFCVSRPRLQDTRIFFVNIMKVKEFRFDSATIEHFRLRSSLLRTTTQNIKILTTLENRKNSKGKRKVDFLLYIIYET